jgi:hypothetical protein
MSAHAHLVPTYLRLRNIGLKLSHKLVETLSKDVLEDGGRKLGIFRKGTLFFDTEDEAAVLMDFCIYDLYPGGRNAVQRMLEDSPQSDPEALALLRAYSRAYYSIFQVVEVERGAGVCSLRIPSVVAPSSWSMSALANRHERGTCSPGASSPGMASS